MVTAAVSPRPWVKWPEAMNGTLNGCLALDRRIGLVMSDSPTWPAHSKPSVERKSAQFESYLSMLDCSTVVNNNMPASGFITRPGELPVVSNAVATTPIPPPSRKVYTHRWKEGDVDTERFIG